MDSQTPRPDLLTKRQREVHALLLGKFPLKEIAYQMGISRDAANVHASHVYRKLAVDGRYELMAQEIARLRALLPQS